MIEQRVLQLCRREEIVSASFEMLWCRVFRGGEIPSRALVPIADGVDADFSLCRIS
jgi:hypothetical protein